MILFFLVAFQGFRLEVEPPILVDFGLIGTLSPGKAVFEVTEAEKEPYQHTMMVERVEGGLLVLLSREVPEKTSIEFQLDASSKSFAEANKIQVTSSMGSFEIAEISGSTGVSVSGEEKVVIQFKGEKTKANKLALMWPDGKKGFVTTIDSLPATPIVEASVWKGERNLTYRRSGL